MNLRRRFIFYLVFIHAILAVLAAYLLQQDRLWLIAVEAVFVVSLAWGIALVSRSSDTLSVVRQSATLLDEGELTTRFREVGQPDIDLLVQVYNRMVDDLRGQRVKLEEQQYFLGQLLQVSPAGVIILDHDGRISQVNASAERLLLLPRAELEGKAPGEVPSPLAAALSPLAAGESLVAALQGGRRVRCQCATFVDRGHSRRFFLVEELTEELRQTEKAAYEKLIRMMSHEVNNSVGATRSLLQSSLAYGETLTGTQREDFEQAVAIATARLERLNSFMRSFADVVRMPPPRLQPCDIEELVEGCVRLVQAQTDPARITWSWDRQARVGEVAIDPAQMEQALINILKNAVEAIGERGSVCVRLGSAGTRAFVEVEDSGPGVPDSVRAMLFTPFFTTKQNGQGIGLTMVQEILRRHGFEYALDGPEGGPTRFRIVL